MESLTAACGLQPKQSPLSLKSWRYARRDRGLTAPSLFGAECAHRPRDLRVPHLEKSLCLAFFKSSVHAANRATRKFAATAIQALL